MILHVLLLFPLLQAQSPFWETKQPSDWTSAEVDQLITDSPWATSEGAHVYFASAKPMREAEALYRRRMERKPGPEAVPIDTEYEEFMRERGDRHIVIAVRIPDLNLYADAREAKQVEKDSQIRVGKRKVKPAGLFPPTPSDPYLRLIFPREIDPSAKNIRVELYIPGAEGKPWREFDFELRRMVYRGKTEY
jgi:hypothetical protein